MSFLAYDFSFPASRIFGQGGVCACQCRAARAHPFGYEYRMITPANEPFNEQITLDPQVRGTMIDTYFIQTKELRVIFVSSMRHVCGMVQDQARTAKSICALLRPSFQPSFSRQPSTRSWMHTLQLFLYRMLVDGFLACG